jgi:hypothetical protein
MAFNFPATRRARSHSKLYRSALGLRGSFLAEQKSFSQINVHIFKIDDNLLNPKIQHLQTFPDPYPHSCYEIPQLGYFVFLFVANLCRKQ